MESVEINKCAINQRRKYKATSGKRRDLYMCLRSEAYKLEWIKMWKPKRIFFKILSHAV